MGEKEIVSWGARGRRGENREAEYVEPFLLCYEPGKPGILFCKPHY